MIEIFKLKRGYNELAERFDIIKNDIMSLIKNEWCRCKPRLLYDEGGGKQLMSVSI